MCVHEQDSHFKGVRYLIGSSEDIVMENVLGSDIKDILLQGFIALIGQWPFHFI